MIKPDNYDLAENDLHNFLGYKNQDVIDSFTEPLDFDESDANIIFRETM